MMPCHNSRSSQTVTDRQTYKHTYISFVSLMLMYYSCIITIRNEVVKVMFLQVSVCPQGGRGCPPQCMVGYTLPGADTPQSRHPLEQKAPQEQTTPQEQTPPQKQTAPQSRHPHPPRADTPGNRCTPHPGSRHPPPRDGHCCGRYTSYWNALLFLEWNHCSNLSLIPLYHS